VLDEVSTGIHGGEVAMNAKVNPTANGLAINSERT